jgi:ABC-type phosphate transport system substrate-binding protein
MRQLKYRAIITVLVLLSALTSVPLNAESPGDIVVFVNNDRSTDSISKDELKQMFLKKKTGWPGGGDRIIPINAPENSPLGERFRQTVLAMTDREESSYWRDQQIRQQLSPPVEMSNTPKAVFKLKNAVSYTF